MDTEETIALQRSSQIALRRSIQRQDTIKMRGEERLKQTTAPGTLIPYVADLISISILGAMLAVPCLFIPLNNPDYGWKHNLNYFVLYQFGVSVVYMLGSYNRLSHMCRRDVMVSESSGKPVFTNMWGLNFRSFAVGLLAACTSCCILAFLGFLCDTWVARSYQMIYACPLVSTVIDVIFILLIPKEERCGAVAGFLANQSALCGIPTFVIFFPIAIKIYMPSLCAAVIPVFVFPIMGNLMHDRVEKSLMKELEQVDFECSFMDSGVPVHLEAMICISEMMLFPGAETVVVLAAIVVCELLQRIYDLRTLLNAMNATSANSSYTAISTTEAPPPELGSRRRRIAMVFSGEDDKAQARARAMELSPEAYAETYMRGVVQLTTLACPLLFVILTYIITVRGNRQYYYVYECLDEEQEFVAVQFAAITLAFQVCFFIMDISFLMYHHTADAFLLLFQSYVKHNRASIACSIAFVCAVFTSCFLIKHDGLAMLEGLVRNCDLESARAAHLKTADDGTFMDGLFPMDH